MLSCVSFGLSSRAAFHRRRPSVLRIRMVLAVTYLTKLTRRCGQTSASAAEKILHHASRAAREKSVEDLGKHLGKVGERRWGTFRGTSGELTLPLMSLREDPKA